MIKTALLTISDRVFQQTQADQSGPQLAQAVRSLGWEVIQTCVVPDEMEQIIRKLSEWADNGTVELILTTGGTGFAARDITPEATLAILEKQAPGIAERIRSVSLQHTVYASLSRAVAGIRAKCLIINLPGSPRGALQGLAAVQDVLPHAIELLNPRPGSPIDHSPPPAA